MCILHLFILMISGEQRENLSAVTSMCEEIFSLEKQFGIINNTEMPQAGELNAKRPRLLQDPSVSSTERNSISPYMLTSTDEYEVSNDIIVISESSEMEEGDGKEEYEENTVETRDHMTQTVEVMKRDDKSEGTEWMGEGRNEDRNVKEWKRNRRFVCLFVCCCTFNSIVFSFSIARGYNVISYIDHFLVVLDSVL